MGYIKPGKICTSTPKKKQAVRQKKKKKKEKKTEGALNLMMLLQFNIRM